jgi:hypothetical protein
MVGMALAKSMYALPTWTRVNTRDAGLAIAAEGGVLADQINGTRVLPLRGQVAGVQAAAGRLP